MHNIVVLYFGYRNLTNVPAEHVLGNPQGDLSVVEFLDYRCGYCREAHPVITEAIARDGNIKYIIRPVTFVDEQSFYAAKALYAAANQGKFAAMHETLITASQDFTEETLEDIAEFVGLDEERFEDDMESDETLGPLRDNYSVFAQIGGNATPTFAIGQRLQYIPEGRMPSVADFLTMFEQAREAGFK